MADEREPLADYLDRLIGKMYVSAERGIGYLSKFPRHMEVFEYIEDEATGRPHPIEDAADHYLLRAFDLLRRDFEFKVPSMEGPRGEQRLPTLRWSDGYVGPGWVRSKEGGGGERVDGHYYADAMSGEIGWRCFHGDPEWPCSECGHPAKSHYKDEEGFSNCSESCNCGWNIGR